MSIEIPEQLKADVPPTIWGKILTSTPVVMTVLATMLAGLASSEMTRAQYERALAAQEQSKAGDQWSFFQAKRLRGALQLNTLDLLQSTAEMPPFEVGALRQASADANIATILNSGSGQTALECLKEGKLPSFPEARPVPEEFKPVFLAIETGEPEIVVSRLIAPIDKARIDQAIKEGREAAAGLDAATKPVNQAIDQLETALKGPGTPQAIRTTFMAARLRYAALRYEMEARLNQSIANLYELQVRKSNIAATRHHARSQRFFYGMLAAQAAVIIATFAIAARQRNLLWSMAAGAGLVAVVLSIYVYFYV